MKKISEKEIEITLDNGAKRRILKASLSECPDCKGQSVRGKELCEGGGVKCITKGCGYWFCY